MGKLDDAVFAFQEALSIKPNDAQANYNMGNALKDQKKLTKQYMHTRRRCHKPDYAEAYLNMGIPSNTKEI